MLRELNLKKVGIRSAKHDEKAGGKKIERIESDLAKCSTIRHENQHKSKHICRIELQSVRGGAKIPKTFKVKSQQGYGPQYRA